MKATEASNIPAHILLSGFGLFNNGYTTVSNSGMRMMMNSGLKACIWSGFIVPKKPISRCMIILNTSMNAVNSKINYHLELNF